MGGCGPKGEACLRGRAVAKRGGVEQDAGVRAFGGGCVPVVLAVLVLAVLLVVVLVVVLACRVGAREALRSRVTRGAWGEGRVCEPRGVLDAVRPARPLRKQERCEYDRQQCPCASWARLLERGPGQAHRRA